MSSASSSDGKSGGGVQSALSERDALASELADLQVMERSFEQFGASTAAVGAATLIAPAAASGGPIASASAASNTSRDSKDPPAPVPAVANDELQEVHLAAAKKAFGDYDLNKNGFIEVNELAYLTAEMGYPLEGKEVQAALKAINTSGSGKIDFNEFWVWWSGATQTSATKDGLALGLLRSRLWLHKGQKLLSQIGKLKGVHFPDAKSWDRADAKTHTVSFAMGEFPAGTGSRLQLKFHHNLILDNDVPLDSKYNVYYSLDVKSAGKGDSSAWLTSVTRHISKHFEQYVIVSVSAPKKDIVRITLGVVTPLPGEPTQVLETYGLTPEHLTRALNLTLEVGTPIAELVGPKRPTLAEVFKVRAEAHIHIENALLQTAQQTMNHMHGNRDARDFAGIIPFIAALESTFNVQFGEVSDFVSYVVEHLRSKYGENADDTKDMKKLGLPVADLLNSAVKYHVKRYTRKHGEAGRKQIPVHMAGVRAALLTIQRDILEVTQIAVWTKTGLGATLEMESFLKLADFLAIVDFMEERLYAQLDGTADGETDSSADAKSGNSNNSSQRRGRPQQNQLQPTHEF